MTWQPMETAPKDGRKIVVNFNSGEGDDPVVVRWNPDETWFGFPWEEDGARRNERFATCWTPLPEPLEQNKAKT